jgi:N-hydroxyarylamine O-acetyltransferase
VNFFAYLRRISYSGPLRPSAEVLCELHRAHMFTVPFENLDIAVGKRITCNEEAILRKIIEQRRGGFCYELNAAFAALLREFDFKVTLLSCRVARDDGKVAPEFDHLALKVDLNEPWLADVGYGDSFVEPLRLTADIEQPQGTRKFRLTNEAGSLCMEMAESGADWKRQYIFDLIPRQLEDFAGMCQYHQTSPESPFTQKRVCSRATPEGRITLAGSRLIITRNGKRDESPLASDEQWREALKKHFDIAL